MDFVEEGDALLAKQEIRVPKAELIECYAFLDPAGVRKPGDRSEKTKARQAIAVVSPDAHARVWVRHLWAGRLTIDELVEKVYSIQAEFKPRLFGCEANAMQSLFAAMLERDARKEEIHLPLFEVKVPQTIDKKFRIRTILQPITGEGRLILPSDLPRDTLAEITGFPLNPRFDVIDALASACKLIPPRAAFGEQGRKKRQRGVANYLKRARGALGNERRHRDEIDWS